MSQSQSEDDNYLSEGDQDVGDFPEAEGDIVEFGWQDERKLSGRRKKAQQAAKKKAKAGTFESMGFSEAVLRGIRRKGFRLPTPIQRKSIPLILQGVDVVGMARTGSGKTAAFVLPMLERLGGQASTAHGARAVILSPTRELALQTHKVVKELGRGMDLRTAVLVGGDSMEAQSAELAAAPDVIVATPGRLAHHLTEVDGFSLKSVEYLVFDEADRLFEMGFAEQLKEIMSAMSPSRQTLLFSATMPKMLAEFARAGLRDPELVRLDADSKLSPDLALSFFTIRQDDKPAALLFLLKEVIPKEQPTIVFTATRHHVDFLAALLKLEGISAASVHGQMDQSARKINIAKFRAGKASVLVVTDVAARGIDIPLLDNVVNYDFPPKPKLFVHRAGRAARAGRTGAAYSFTTRDEMGYLVDLHLFLSRPLNPAPVRALKDASAAVDQESGPQITSTTFGAFPLAALDDSLEHLRSVIETNSDLSSQLNAANNAMKLYVKTRAPAAPESARRAKEFPKEGVHALLAASLPSDALGGLEAQECLADITAKLRAYRPSQTVFEAEVASARAGYGAGLAATPGVLAAAVHERRIEVMKKKREAHATVIAAVKNKASNFGSNNKEEDDVDSGSEDEFDDDNSDEDRELDGSSSDDDDSYSSEEEDEEEDEDGNANNNKRQRDNKTKKRASKGEDNNNIAPSKKRRQNSKQQQSKNSRPDFLLDSRTADDGSVPLPGGGPSGRYKEDGFYISHVPTGNATAERFMAVGSGDQLRDAVLDLTAEDAEGAARQKSSQWHWDTKSKRYVKLQKGETMKAGRRVKDRNGGKISGGKKDAATGALYQKWARRTKLSVGSGKITQRTEQLAAAMEDRFKRGGRGWSNPLKPGADRDDEDGPLSGGKGGKGKKGGKSPAGRRDELRTADEVRKNRKMEERKKEHLQKRQQEARRRDNQTKGKRGGFGGSRGGGRGGGGRGGGSSGGFNKGRGGSSSGGGGSTYKKGMQGKKGPGKKISKGRGRN